MHCKEGHLTHRVTDTRILLRKWDWNTFLHDTRINYNILNWRWGADNLSGVFALVWHFILAGPAFNHTDLGLEIFRSPSWPLNSLSMKDKLKHTEPALPMPRMIPQTSHQSTIGRWSTSFPAAGKAFFCIDPER